MSVAIIAWAGLVLGVAAGLQTAVGFGMGLFAIPLLLRLGLDLPHAVAIVVGGATIQTGLGAWRNRALVDLKLAAQIGSCQWLAMPAGVALMAWLSDSGPLTVKRGVGMVILAAVFLGWLLRPEARKSVAWYWRGLAGGCAGLLAGSVGMGGPPLVLFGMTHDWTADRFRVFLWTQLLVGVPAIVTLLTWRFGLDVLGGYATGLSFAPLVWAGGMLGARASHGWSATLLQRMAAGLLVLLAITPFLSNG